MTTMPENNLDPEERDQVRSGDAAELNQQRSGEAAELDQQLDRRMEALLLEALLAESSEKPALPPDFAARLSSDRPFAPWEVKHAGTWKVPLAVGSTLLAGSAGIALAPLWHLGPGTAAGVWGRILVASVAQPLNTAFTAGPLLADALGKVPAGGVVLLGLSALVAVGGAAFVLRPRVGARS